jgi:UrcA family protein
MQRTSLLCAAALMVASSPAFAETVVTGKRHHSVQGPLTKVVSYRDLDITTAAGEKTLMRRVSGAVRFVCSPATHYMQESSCRSFAWKGARPQLELALNQAKTNPALAAATLSTLRVSAPF